jgi:hypothetical protein
LALGREWMGGGLAAEGEGEGEGEREGEAAARRQRRIQVEGVRESGAVAHEGRREDVCEVQIIISPRPVTCSPTR